MAAGDQDDNSLYFASTQMQARYEELEAADKCDTNINHRIAELQTFKMIDSNTQDSFETFTKDKSLRERNFKNGEIKKAKSKKIKSMTSLMANTFNENRSLRGSQETNKKECNSQLSILKFFPTVKPLHNSNECPSPVYELNNAIYDKLEWLDIVRCIRIHFSKRFAKRKKEHFTECCNCSHDLRRRYPGDIESMWAYASAPPENGLENEDIKTLYDFSDEDFLMSEAVEDERFHDYKLGCGPRMVSMSQSLVDPKADSKSCHDGIVSDSSPEPEPLTLHPLSNKVSSKVSLSFCSPQSGYSPFRRNSLENQKNQNGESFQQKSFSDVSKTSRYPQQYDLTEFSTPAIPESFNYVDNAPAESPCTTQSEYMYIAGNRLNLHEGKHFWGIVDEMKSEFKHDKSTEANNASSVGMRRGTDDPSLFSDSLQISNADLETHLSPKYDSRYSPLGHSPEQVHNKERRNTCNDTGAFQSHQKGELVSYLRVDSFFSRFDWAKEKILGTSISVSESQNEAEGTVEDSSDEEFNPFCILRLSRSILLEANSLQELACLSNNVHVNKPILQVPSSPQLENSNCLDPFDYGCAFDTLPVHSQ